MNILNLMEQAKNMQKKMQEELETLTIEGSAGGGMVKVRMTGLKSISNFEVDQSLLVEGDKAMLEDLLAAACHDAYRRCESAVKEKLGPLGTELGLPGMR